ncbi:MAG TPA: nucleotidyltransferase family protein [Actinomycetota bacterium]|nr:nucleotidyltransferase family protein [Actinomycetota bacterium]
MISGIVLAGGTSSRLGQPKQLLELEGRPLLQHIVDTAASAGSGLGEVVVVLGHLAGDVASALTLPPSARTVVNPEYATGQASSMRTGLVAASPGSDGAVILLGDQPGMPAAHIAAVVAAFEGGAGPIVQASFRGTPSHPVLFARSVWAELMAVTGDKGAREVIKAHPDWVVRVDLDAEIPPDLDTMEDYRRLRGQ